MGADLDLGELLPDAAPAGARLPRRQAGGSPQNRAVTLLADYGLRSRLWFPSAALVELLGAFGVTPGGARTAINRLAQRGVIEGSREGRRTSYRLTDAAAAALTEGGHRVVAFAAQAEAWDGHWTLVAFTLPQQRDTDRRALRARLRWLGYEPLFDGLWVSPNATTPAAVDALRGAGPAAVAVFRARPVDLGGLAVRDPLDAWDLAGIAEEYGGFFERWTPVLRRLCGGGLPGGEALRVRTDVMDDYRRFPGLDPQVPLALLPEGWPRRRARELFAALYDGLAGPALDHVLAVVARHAGDPAPRVATHTVGDLLAWRP